MMTIENDRNENKRVQDANGSLDFKRYVDVNTFPEHYRQ